MVKKRKIQHMEYFDKKRNRWIKVMVEKVDDKLLEMHDYVIAQIDIHTTMEEMKDGIKPEKN